VRFFHALPKERKRSLILLVPLAFLTGLADVAVVALVSRVFTLMSGGANNPSIPFSDLITNDPTWKIIYLIIIYVGMNWIASFLKLLLKANQIRLKAKIWRDLSNLAHKNILSQNYEYFLGKKTTDLSSTILINITRIAQGIVLPILELISGSVVIFLIFIALLKIAKSIALYVILSILICYIIISLTVTPFIRLSVRQKIRLERESNNIINESFRTIIDLQLTGSENYFQNKYEKVGQKAIPFIWKAELLPEAPRALIEPTGITLIFLIGLIPIINSDTQNIIEIIPFLATIAVCCLKITPPLQDAFRAITSLRSCIPDLEEALKLIELTRFRNNVNKFTGGIIPRKTISLSNLSYKYPVSSKLILNDINITIPVGSKIAFVGKTGSGKTTTVNQLLCLLRPTSGSLQIDGIDVDDSEVSSWQACCSYVPQSFNLLNSSIMENVAYGVKSDSINIDKVWDSLQAAQIADLVADMPFGLYTAIGENGIRLSGGQRQRIALARAFFRKSSLLVLDEATSALDNKTESDVMNSIELIGRRCTMVIIAHRLSTVKRADIIYEFENGKIKAYGNYEKLLETSNSFKEMTKVVHNKTGFNEYFDK
tara:strand:- start:3424 stop:5223 length:1800 start_codon:yes stop_codon:yes gene_type:complete